MKTICERIAEICAKYKGSQAELAEAAGVTPQLLNAVIKRRKGERLSALTAAKICQAAGMPAEDFGKMLYQLARR